MKHSIFFVNFAKEYVSPSHVNNSKWAPSLGRTGMADHHRPLYQPRQNPYSSKAIRGKITKQIANNAVFSGLFLGCSIGHCFLAIVKPFFENIRCSPVASPAFHCFQSLNQDMVSGTMEDGFPETPLP